MRSLNRVGTLPMSLPLAADDIVEFHAARLLLLMHVCGVKGRIDGLTKLRIPIEAARVYRFDGAQRSDMMAPTLPI